MRRLLPLLAVVWFGVARLGLNPFASTSGIDRDDLTGKWHAAFDGQGTGIQRIALSDLTLEFFHDGTVLQSGGPFGNTGFGGYYEVDGTTVKVALGPPGARGRAGGPPVAYAVSDDGDSLTTVTESGSELVYRRAE